MRSLALPCVIAADEAKGMADALLAREWAMRDRLTVWLGPDHFDLEPGDVLTVPGSAGAWVVERLTIERSVVVAECRPAAPGAATARTADAGRVNPQPDVVALPSRLVLLDLPEGAVPGIAGPCLQLAVASPSNTWRQVPLSIAVGGVTSAAQSAAVEAVIGNVVGVLADGAAAVVDPAHTIEVVLANADKWLMSADSAALDAGANLAAVGGELVQFAGAEPVGPGRFLLTGLRRGRRGSEAATTGHGPSEAFVLIVPAALKVLAFAEAQVGMTATVTALGVGNTANPPQVSRVITA